MACLAEEAGPHVIRLRLSHMSVQTCICVACEALPRGSRWDMGTPRHPAHLPVGSVLGALISPAWPSWLSPRP